ncbi:GNAT family N-acetyltransferase [Rhizobium sp. SSA_523]|uniref:GNAT family N-acetyltransferase n=1 Tax=Rhizobium sp. SSA_523 TaxID=2952477 RepID=UPI002090FE66|nr:GNAT family N-acetyltransferase [Rhizobium sp. SSA_523]MCO5734068.1 GNAT family N-acetyltransferase [Rhizobium sp. SSA_523]WKC24706.1 GNAT family N-acetyltransferase [Rhizobium sp. SSA_523]
MTICTLRQLGPDDAAEAARVHRSSLNERLPWLADLHTPQEDHAFWRDHLLMNCSVCGAYGEGHLLGVVAYRKGWIEQLYVLPTAQGRGIGSALLAAAKEGRESLDLWTFQANQAARRFYEKRGFVSVEETDGQGNDEGEPDVRYRWLATA